MPVENMVQGAAAQGTAAGGAVEWGAVEWGAAEWGLLNGGLIVHRKVSFRPMFSLLADNNYMLPREEKIVYGIIHFGTFPMHQLVLSPVHNS